MLNAITIKNNKDLDDFTIDFTKCNIIAVALWDSNLFNNVFSSILSTTKNNKFYFKKLKTIRRTILKYRYLVNEQYISPNGELLDSNNKLIVDFDFDIVSPFDKEEENELDEIEEMKDFVQGILKEYNVSDLNFYNKYILALYIFSIDDFVNISKDFLNKIKFELQRMFLTKEEASEKANSVPLMSRFIFLDFNEIKNLKKSFSYSNYFHLTYLINHLAILVNALDETQRHLISNKLSLKLARLLKIITKKDYSNLEIIFDKKNGLKIKHNYSIKSLYELDFSESIAVFLLINEPFIDLYKFTIFNNEYLNLNSNMFLNLINYLREKDIKIIFNFRNLNSIPKEIWNANDINYLYFDHFFKQKLSSQFLVDSIKEENILKDKNNQEINLEELGESSFITISSDNKDLDKKKTKKIKNKENLANKTDDELLKTLEIENYLEKTRKNNKNFVVQLSYNDPIISKWFYLKMNMYRISNQSLLIISSSLDLTLNLFNYLYIKNILNNSDDIKLIFVPSIWELRNYYHINPNIFNNKKLMFLSTNEMELKYTSLLVQLEMNFTSLQLLTTKYVKFNYSKIGEKETNQFIRHLNSLLELNVDKVLYASRRKKIREDARKKRGW